MKKEVQDKTLERLENNLRLQPEACEILMQTLSRYRQPVFRRALNKILELPLDELFELNQQI